MESPAGARARCFARNGVAVGKQRRHSPAGARHRRVSVHRQGPPCWRACATALATWCSRGRKPVSECFCVDLRHRPGEHRENGITFVGADLREWLPPPRRYAIVFAFPPCTSLAVSGARWFREKGIRGLTEAVELVEACRRLCEWSGAPWMLENPVSTLASYWRSPDFDISSARIRGLAWRKEWTITASAPASGRVADSGCRKSGRFPSFVRSTSTTCHRPKTVATFAASRRRASPARCSRRIAVVRTRCKLQRMPWSRSEGMFTVPFDMLA